MSFVLELNRTSLTIGDFVAHAFSTNRISEVMRFLDDLLPGFRNELRQVHPRWREEKSNWPLQPIIRDSDELMRRLSRLLEVRHIVVHELPTNRVFDTGEPDGWFDAVQEFIEACDWITVKELFGSIPRTQIQMNLNAGEALQVETEAMKQAHSLVFGDVSLSQSDVDRVQELWASFAKAQAELLARPYEGGSLKPMVFAQVLTELTEDRAEQILGLASHIVD